MDPSRSLSSLSLFWALLRIAIFNICYIRGFFPENYFSELSVPVLEMKIKKLKPMDAESRRMLNLMEKEVCEGLQQKHLRTLEFWICTSFSAMIEKYTFSFSDNDSLEVLLETSGNKKRGTFKFNSTAPNQMSSACQEMHSFEQFMRTLDKLPEEHIIEIKLIYCDGTMHWEPTYIKGGYKYDCLPPKVPEMFGTNEDIVVYRMITENQGIVDLERVMVVRNKDLKTAKQQPWKLVAFKPFGSLQRCGCTYFLDGVGMLDPYWTWADFQLLLGRIIREKFGEGVLSFTVAHFKMKDGTYRTPEQYEEEQTQDKVRVLIIPFFIATEQEEAELRAMGAPI